MRHPNLGGAALALAALLAASPAAGQEEEDAANPPPPAKASHEDLAKQTQNPVSSLTSVPFQFNFFSGGPLVDRTLLNLNIQPVFPFPLGHVNLIARTIVPYLDIPVGASDERIKGIGDIQEQLFLTPAGEHAITVGVGPVLSFPTATNDAAKTGDWAIGPAAVALVMPGQWVIGALLTQLWTFAGDEVGPNINQMNLQPFVNYNLPRGWSLAFAPIFSANWAAPPGEKWTIPLGMGVSKVAALGRQPISLTLQYYYNVERPSTTGASQLRLAISFLFPSAPKKS
jgi:hypothetical protein